MFTVFDAIFNLTERTPLFDSTQDSPGKSTIISLLERFYDVNKKSIKIDSVDIRDYHLPSLRAHMALVSQEPSLYDMTIGENIAMGARNDTDLGSTSIKKSIFFKNTAFITLELL